MDLTEVKTYEGSYFIGSTEFEISFSIQPDNEGYLYVDLDTLEFENADLLGEDAFESIENEIKDGILTEYKSHIEGKIEFYYERTDDE